MTTTQISDYAKKAINDVQSEEQTILLNLRDMAPGLLERALHPEQLSDTADRRRSVGSEFAMAVRFRARELRGDDEGNLYRRTDPEGLLAQSYERMLINGATAIPLASVPDLIGVCERMSERYESCAALAKMEAQRRRIAAAGPGCGFSWIRWQEDHVRDHHECMAAWLGLAAYLAARLDAVGRVLASVPACEPAPAVARE